MKRLISIMLLLLAACSGSVTAQDIPAPMHPPRLVNDFARILSTEERDALENKLRNYHDSTSTQIYVVTVNSLKGYAISDFTFRLGEKWGIGQKGKDNGAVILIKPKRNGEKGKAFIATGYGLEGVIPDATARKIVVNEMIPFFKKNSYYRGINAAVDVMIELLAGQYSAEEYNEEGSPIAGIVLFIIFFAFIITSAGNRSRLNSGSIGKNVPFWLLMGMMSGGGRGSGFGNFSSGSGSFGGFSGGGGGSFGGGGAGGSW